jgi:hypothetical protein
VSLPQKKIKIKFCQGEGKIDAPTCAITVKQTHTHTKEKEKETRHANTQKIKKKRDSSTTRMNNAKVFTSQTARILYEKRDIVDKIFVMRQFDPNSKWISISILGTEWI